MAIKIVTVVVVIIVVLIIIMRIIVFIFIVIVNMIPILNFALFTSEPSLLPLSTYACM